MMMNLCHQRQLLINLRQVSLVVYIFLLIIFKFIFYIYFLGFTHYSGKERYTTNLNKIKKNPIKRFHPFKLDFDSILNELDIKLNDDWIKNETVNFNEYN